MAFNNVPHPEEAAKAAVSKSLPLAKAGDAPPPPPVVPAELVPGSDPGAATPSPYAAAIAPAPRFRGANEHRTGITTHPEN